MSIISSETITDLHIKAGLEYCLKNNPNARIIFAIPYEIPEAVLHRIIIHPNVVALIHNNPLQIDPPSGRQVYLSQYDPFEYGWALPDSSADCILWFGEIEKIGVRKAVIALTSGIRHIYYIDSGFWKSNGISTLSGNVALRRILEIIQQYTIRKIQLLVQRKFSGLSLPFIESQRGLNSLAKFRLPPANSLPVSKRVMMFNNSLASGGAERQLVYSVLGLSNRHVNDFFLLCNSLDPKQGHDFYLNRLDQHIKITVPPLVSPPPTLNWPEEDNQGGSQLIEDAFDELIENLRSVPENFREYFLKYLFYVFRLRPQVIHAWQDMTNLAAGFAGILCGTPRIVLSTRNMAPIRFEYFQPWMRPAYRILADFDNVVFVNNSRAGARDYAEWLDIDPSRFHIHFNAIDEETIVRPQLDELKNYRDKLGIPDTAPTVGSVFRFYSEKDPDLWIKSAVKVAENHPDVHFLLIGDGPLRQNIVEVVRNSKLESRIHMPGEEARIELAISAMDVFMLTSRAEGTPNVCIEAQALGVPVVGTNAGGIADTFIDGKTGWLINSRSSSAIAERVLFTLNSKTWRKEAGKCASEHVLNKFGMERMIDEILDVYKF